MMSKGAFLYLAAITAISALDLPSDFPKCKRSDPKLNECIRSAYDASLPLLDKGIPEIRNGSFFPIVIGSLSIGEGTGPVKFHQHYENAKYFNLEFSNAKSVEAIVTDDEFKILMHVFVNIFRMEGDYDFDGSVMSVPIVGKGRCIITLTNITLTFDMVGEFFEKDNEKYVKLRTFNVLMDPDLFETELTNLFNGDAQLGAEVTNILNSNWAAVFSDVKHGYEEALGRVLKSSANLIFTKIPYNNLFPL